MLARVVLSFTLLVCVEMGEGDGEGDHDEMGCDPIGRVTGLRLQEGWW